MLKRKFIRVFTMAILASIAIATYADDAAPVFDADNYPPSFDGQPIDSSMTPPPEPSIDQSQQPQPLSLDQRLSRLEQQVTNVQQKDAAGKIDGLQTEIQSLRGQVEQLTHQLQQAQAQQTSMFADLDKRLSNQQLASKDQPVVTPAPRAPSVDSADSTQNEVATLKARVEKLTRQLRQAQNQQAVKVGNNKPLKSTASAINPTPAPAPAPAAPRSSTSKKSDKQPNVAEEQQIYQTAYDLIKAKKYNEAISALQRMLQKYPTGQFAANAHYWLGELFGLLGKNAQSAVEFSQIVKNYPDSPKVSDAQLKLGLIFAGQFKWTDAKNAFKKVINRYPGTASARLAAEQLRQIKEAGH